MEIRRKAIISSMSCFIILVSFLVSGYGFRPEPLNVDKSEYVDPVISFYMQDSEVETAINQLKETWNLTIITDEPLKGRVTCSFNNMPVTEVLRILVGADQFNVRRQGNIYHIVRIEKPGTVDRSKRNEEQFQQKIDAIIAQEKTDLQTLPATSPEILEKVEKVENGLAQTPVQPEQLTTNISAKLLHLNKKLCPKTNKMQEKKLKEKLQNTEKITKPMADHSILITPRKTSSKKAVVVKQQTVAKEVILDKTDNDLKELIALGNTYKQNKQLVSARKVWQTAAKKSPTNDTLIENIEKLDLLIDHIQWEKSQADDPQAKKILETYLR